MTDSSANDDHFPDDNPEPDDELLSDHYLFGFLADLRKELRSAVSADDVPELNDAFLLHAADAVRRVFGVMERESYASRRDEMRALLAELYSIVLEIVVFAYQAGIEIEVLAPEPSAEDATEGASELPGWMQGA